MGRNRTDSLSGQIWEAHFPVRSWRQVKCFMAPQECKCQDVCLTDPAWQLAQVLVLVRQPWAEPLHVEAGVSAM